jgi:hypothetical protein
MTAPFIDKTPPRASGAPRSIQSHIDEETDLAGKTEATTPGPAPA